MLIQFKEQKIGDYIIPSFTLSENEIIVLKFPNEPSAYTATSILNNFLTGKIANSSVIINKQFTYVKHSGYNHFIDIFFPLTVKRLISRAANNPSSTYRKISEEINWLKPNTKIEKLAGGHRKLIFIFSTFSKTQNIIFDLMGLDTDNRRKIYNIVKSNVSNQGAAILYDFWDDFKYDNSEFIIKPVRSNY